MKASQSSAHDLGLDSIKLATDFPSMMFRSVFETSEPRTLPPRSDLVWLRARGVGPGALPLGVLLFWFVSASESRPRRRASPSFQGPEGKSAGLDATRSSSISIEAITSRTSEGK